jgi:hypothetical protein
MSNSPDNIKNSNDSKKNGLIMKNYLSQSDDNTIKNKICVDNLDYILNSNDFKKIGPFMKNYLSQSNDKIEKVIKICVNNYNEEKFFDFLCGAIYSDKVIVFKIMNNNNYKYDIEHFKKLAILYKSPNCINYFNSTLN